MVIDEIFGQSGVLSRVLICTTMTSNGTLSLCFHTSASTCGTPSLPVSTIAMNRNLLRSTLLSSTVVKRYYFCWRGVRDSKINMLRQKIRSGK